jgi:hypothetical protein
VRFALHSHSSEATEAKGPKCDWMISVHRFLVCVSAISKRFSKYRNRVAIGRNTDQLYGPSASASAFNLNVTIGFLDLCLMISYVMIHVHVIVTHRVNVAATHN